MLQNSPLNQIKKEVIALGLKSLLFGSSKLYEDTALKTLVYVNDAQHERTATYKPVGDRRRAAVAHIVKTIPRLKPRDLYFIVSRNTGSPMTRARLRE